MYISKNLGIVSYRKKPFKVAKIKKIKKTRGGPLEVSSVKRRYFKEFPNKVTYFKDCLPKESFEGFFYRNMDFKSFF